MEHSVLQKHYPKRVIHQQVFVSIDLTSQQLDCTSNLTLELPEENKGYIEFDFAIDSITNCEVNQNKVNYEFHNPTLGTKEALYAKVDNSKSFQVHHLEQQLPKPFDSSSSPCLKIFLPESLIASDIPTTEPLEVQDRETPAKNYSTILVSISYTIYGSNAAVFFRRVDTHSYVYIDSFFTGACYWIPCVDNLFSRNTFSLILSVATEMFAIASGNVEDTVLANDESTVQYYYRLNQPTFPSNISFIAGPFKVLPDPVYPASITYFVLPGYTKMLANTVRFLSKMIPKIESTFSKIGFPFPSVKMVFLYEGDGRQGQGQCFAGELCLVPGDILYSDDIIDQVYESRRKLVNLFCGLYVGDCGILSPKHANDVWLVHGLQHFIGMQFLKDMFGTNWCKTCYLEMARYLCQSSDGGGCLVSNEHSLRFPNLYEKGANIRSLLIIYMISKRLSLETVVKGTEQLILEAQEENARKDITCLPEGDAFLVDKMDRFVELVATKNPKALKEFISRWILTCDILKLRCGYRYDSKKKFVELAVKQSVITFRSHDGKRIEKDFEGQSSDMELFKGSLTVQVMEMEGPHDHLLEMDNDILLVELPTSTRRLKQHHQRQNDSPKKDTNHLVTDTAVDSALIEKDPVLWVRVDPDEDWILKVLEFRRSEMDSISCLRNCRDVFGQLEALETLMMRTKGRLSIASIRCLEQMLYNHRIYHQVRGECARCLAKCHTINDQFIGLDALLNFIKKKYFDDQGVVLPNEFQDISEYFVKCAVIQALSPMTRWSFSPVYGYDWKFRISLTQLPSTSPIPYDVLILLTELLEQNDNSYQQPFDDCFYLSNLLVTCAICAVFAKDEMIRQRVYKQLFRYLKREKAIPSYHHVITASALKGLTILQQSGILNMSSKEDEETNEWEKALKKSLMSHHLFLQKTTMECLLALYGKDVTFLQFLFDHWIGNTTEKYHRTRRSLIRQLKQHINHQTIIRKKLRMYHEQSIAFCSSWFRWLVKEMDPFMQWEGRVFAKQTWGTFVPLCLLTNEEYERERYEREKAHKERQELDYRFAGKKLVIVSSREDVPQTSAFPNSGMATNATTTSATTTTNITTASNDKTVNVNLPLEVSSSPVVHSERISEEKPGWLVEDIMANIMKQQTLDEEDEKYMKMFLEGASRGVTSKHALKIALETYGLKMLISRMKKQEKPDYFKTPKELE
eukprot:jgi/Galph1/1300/GphlegSOOS_G5949.1